MKKNIVYVDTIYPLLIYLVLGISNSHDLYIFGEEIPKEICNKFKNNYRIIYKIKYKIKLEQYYKYYKIKKILEKILNNYTKFNNLYLQDHLRYSNFFINEIGGNNFILEDGIMNYSIDKKKILQEITERKLIKKIREKLLFGKDFIFLSLGLSEKITKIYLTGILPVPEIIKDKVEIIDIETKWNLLSIEKKKEILDIFDINLEKLENLKNEKEKILLITQPLSEDNIISEEEKIDIYSNLLKERDIKKIYIKPHPREKTDYTKVFQNIEVVIIEKEFPIEIFILLNMEFKKVITLFSTAALNFKNKYDVEFIGTKDYKALYDKFGDIKI